MGSRMDVIPLYLREANEFVLRLHRHQEKVQTHLFSLGSVKDGQLVGVSIINRPCAIPSDDGLSAEVSRLCTDGTRNACSFLYAASAKTAFAMGYHKIGTFILKEETGVSLKSAGWKLVGERGGGTWNTRLRPRVDKHPLGRKWLYEMVNPQSKNRDLEELRRIKDELRETDEKPDVYMESLFDAV